MSTLLLYSAPRSGAGDDWMTFLPLGLGSLQAMLRSRGYPCRLANLSGKSRREVLAYLRQQRPDLVGVSMFTFNRQRSLELVAWAREACPGALLLAGGPHPTHLADEVLAESPALDAIVLGEGERSLLDLVGRLAAGEDWRGAPGLRLRTGATPCPPPIEDLDSIGFPAEHFQADFFRDPTQLAYLATSRGCPATCTFCNTPGYWGSAMRFRSPASVLAELDLLRRKHGLTYFSFRDDTFTARKGRILELMALLRESGHHPLWNCQSRVNLVDEERLVAMVRAGCEFMQFGVEHGSARMLAQLDKGTRPEQIRKTLAQVRKVGIQLGIYLITGIPGETWEDVEASADLIRQVRPHDVQVAPLAIYPGTRIWEEALASGRVDGAFFRTAGDAEVFARMDGHTERALRHLEALGERAKAAPTYTPEEFAEQKRFLGFCAVTNLLCGEAAERAGRWPEAEAEYSEIIAREPDNPWGWQKRALLHWKQGHRARARGDLREVLALAPGNPEAEELRAIWKG
jgi:anaerobic magnesium-protoporphyrin IX monomethyl ester cyclase